MEPTHEVGSILPRIAGKQVRHSPPANHNPAFSTKKRNRTKHMIRQTRAGRPTNLPTQSSKRGSFEAK